MSTHKAEGTLTINGCELPYPEKFVMQQVPNVVCEIQTMTGDTKADINGWKWADTTITWKALGTEDLNNLLLAIAEPTFTMTFIYAPGMSATAVPRKKYNIEAILKNYSAGKTRYQETINNQTANGYKQFVWEDISITLSFPKCYQY